MSDLGKYERRKLEELFYMNGGYVLDFSNNTFEEFIHESVGVEIYSLDHEYHSNSKANMLRAFWDQQPNHVVGKLNTDLINHWQSIRTKDSGYYDKPNELVEHCNKINARLKENQPVENIDVFRANSRDKDFAMLSKTIKESIAKNEPEIALDRIHTFVVKFIREICTKHEIEIKQDHPLHSLFGSYVKFLVKEELIESRMTENILKSSISVMEAFNDVRNNKSFAHDNKILNYDESILIINDIANVIKFIETVERKAKSKIQANQSNSFGDDLPF
ncbi:MAG: abortive infection family protein [Cyclobacteriaceae bacterium]